MINKIFFAKEGERGLNETSAQHICALASQLKDEAEKRLNNICFLNTKTNIIGSSGPEMPTKIGFSKEEFDQIMPDLQVLADMNSVIAWFAEARKQLEAWKEESRKTSMDEWLKLVGKEMPIFETQSYATTSFKLDDMKDTLSVKELQEYLALEAQSSVIGQFIHPTKPLERARAELHTKLTQPYSTKGEGHDMIVNHYEASIDPKLVDQVFIDLQQKYRRTEQALNKMKSDLRHKADIATAADLAKEREVTASNQQAYSDYSHEYALLRNEYNQWLRDEETRLSKVKFIIPDALNSIVEHLNKL